MPSARDYLGNTSSTQDVLLLALLGVGVYVVYQLIQGVKATAQLAGSAATAVYHGTQTLTAPVANALANTWSAMSGISGGSAMAQLGNAVWPDGTLTPLSQLTLKQDTLGNVYVSDGQGLLFQLQPHDSNGNYPAVQITDPSQIGQAPAPVGPVSPINTGNIPGGFIGGATPGGW